MHLEVGVEAPLMVYVPIRSWFEGEQALEKVEQAERSELSP